ncbi:hypothetical protein [Mycobacterium intracellulare]|uniref:Uncharacterized protein n=1 Tax=Mycobacterium intracellulare TaxID=1767 RepID=A0AAE4RGW4_MYCIT|nr:hypothetical protein [Mycobacterium intracellulare]MDV6979855.1 hypothetical protein [Mycobacterium intracellulare]MDV6985418.1 hypothetical protein [Mycobacterium intracellulare]MDV7015646.1 hypothetical protein [Mycobacterium intracellulare]MDV7030357.1 hypothetical protein [Mycobacterium intracellulare]
MTLQISPVRDPSVRHSAVNSNIADQQQHSVNTTDNHADGEQQPADSSDENGEIVHG